MLKVRMMSAVMLILFSSSLFSQNEMPKNYQSLLWEISGNGLKAPSYLYGTMHVSDKLAFNLPDSFFIAMKKCDAVALELDMGLWMDELMLMFEAEQRKNTYPYYSKHYGFYRNAFWVDAPKEKDLKSILQFTPRISNRLMYRNNKQNSDYEEDNYLDVFIYQAGKKLNKHIIGLENFRQTEEFSNKAEEEDDPGGDEKAKEDEKEQVRLRLKQLRGDKSYYDVLEDAYRKGDLDLLDSLNKLVSTKNFLRYMLYERNEIMAHNMDSVMRKMSLFTGVGAAHLPGDKGVIELLRRRGYTVRPVVASGADIRSKTHIDETRYPVQFTVQYSSDSAFSVAVPGKLYEISDEGSFKYYLHNDMSNGSYYCVQRMNHYGKLMDQTPEVILKRLDSLVFENIPGKLLSKKEIKSPNGYPGIEIMNKTAKGDIQRHQVFITPQEIYAFKMSGIQEYVKKGAEADNFFSSITFYEPLQGSAGFASKYGYTVDLPLNRVVNSAVSRIRSQKEIVCAYDKGSGTHYLVMAASLYDFDYIEEDTFELNMLAERFCLETSKKLLSRTYVKKNGSEVLYFKAEHKNNPALVFNSQVIIHGAGYYLLATNADSAKAQPFFSSFSLTPKQQKVPFTTVTDTSLFFSVSTQELRNGYTDLMKKKKDNYSYFARKTKDPKEDNLFLPKRESLVYTSPETDEQVFVEFRKFSMYYQEESMQEFWKSMMESVSENGMLKLSRITNTKKGNSTEVNLLVTDTNSSRGIVVRFIQRCGTLYTLKTVIDTVKGMDVYAKTFFETFTPKDTCMGIDITSNKLDEHFFGKLYSADTTESNPARTAIEYVQANILPANVPALIKAVEHKEFSTLSPDQKRELIACFGRVKPSQALPFLEGLYSRYADSVDIQLTILRTVARLKTAESVKTFLKLLKVDVPVTANDYAISNLFSYFSDSLENAALLFPEIIKYTQYPEYKSSVYKLMAEVNDAGALRSKVYRKQLDQVLLDANYELKKYISQKDRDKEDYRYSYYKKQETIYDELNLRQQKVYNYASVLAPYYRNADVKKFFNKLLSTTTSDRYRAVVYGKLIQNNIAVHDSVIKQLAASVASRATLYRVLKDQGKIQMFDNAYLAQQELVISQLFGSSENFKGDTLVLMAVNKVEFDKKEGYVYIFKIRPKDKKVWKLCYSAVHPGDQSDLCLKPLFTKTNIAFDSEMQSKKEIDNLMRRIRVEHRRRAVLKDFELETSNDYYWDY